MDIVSGGLTVDKVGEALGMSGRTYQRWKIISERGSKPDRLKAQRAGPPSNNCIGFGAYPVGGLTDFYTFSKVDGYSLPFKVWGFFDLRDSETSLSLKQVSEIIERKSWI